MNYFCFEHLWSDLPKPFISQSSKRAKTPTTKFLLHILNCLPILLHKYKVKATWKHVYKLTRCKMIASLLGDCPFNYMLLPPQSSHFFWGGWKKCFYVARYLIHCEQYEQIQGDRDYSSNSTRKENSMPGLLHQYIVIPSRSNRIICLPRKKKRKNTDTSYKPRQDLF